MQHNIKSTPGIKLETDFSCKGDDMRVALNLYNHFELFYAKMEVVSFREHL